LLACVGLLVSYIPLGPAARVRANEVRVAAALAHFRHSL